MRPENRCVLFQKKEARVVKSVDTLLSILCEKSDPSMFERLYPMDGCAAIASSKLRPITQLKA